MHSKKSNPIVVNLLEAANRASRPSAKDQAVAALDLGQMPFSPLPLTAWSRIVKPSVGQHLVECARSRLSDARACFVALFEGKGILKEKGNGPRWAPLRGGQFASARAKIFEFLVRFGYCSAVRKPTFYISAILLGASLAALESHARTSV